jgi:hypothetical protein
MAGLIQSEMPAPEAEMPAPEAEEGPDENNPAFVQAMKFALSVLYKEGAAKHVAEQLRTAKDKVDALADVAYEITRVVDERTQGAVPRELIGLLAMAILNEVMDIGEAAKMGIAPADAAGAFKQMILRYLGENGVDTSQLQQGMDKIDPSMFGGA